MSSSQSCANIHSIEKKSKGCEHANENGLGKHGSQTSASQIAGLYPGQRALCSDKLIFNVHNAIVRAAMFKLRAFTLIQLLLCTFFLGPDLAQQKWGLLAAQKYERPSDCR
jgi:hypothetical protein